MQQIIAADAAADLAGVLATLRENLERKDELREIQEALDALRAELDQTFDPGVASASFGTLVPYWSGAADNSAGNLTVAIESLPPEEAAAVNGFLGSSGLAEVVFVEASDPPVEVTRAVDRDFADGDWSAIPLPAAAPETGSGGVTRQPEGGKPGAFLRAPLVWGSGAPGAQRTALGFLRWDAFEWDPSVDGEIGTLRLLADLRFGEDGRPGQSAVSGSIALGIEQNDSVYLLRGQGLSAQDPLPGRWQTYQEIVTEPSAFRKVSGPGPEEPDLSPTGAPIRFGVRIGAATSLLGVSIAFDLDNYKAEISAPVRAVPGLTAAGAWILATLLASVALGWPPKRGSSVAALSSSPRHLSSG